MLYNDILMIKKEIVKPTISFFISYLKCRLTIQASG